MEANLMNRQETERLLTAITNYYPNYFKDFSVENVEFQINMWHRSLADCEIHDVMNAFEVWINTEERPPTLPNLSL